MFAKRVTEWTLNGLSLLFLAYLVIAGVRAYAMRPDDAVSARVQPPYLVGKSLSALLPSVSWESGQTLVLFTRSTCPYCQQSVPFHQKLLALSESSGIPAIALSDDPQLNLEAALAAQRLQFSEAHSVMLSRLGSVGTPTIALVDKSGVIRRAWQGILSEKRENEVMNVIAPSVGTKLTRGLTSGTAGSPLALEIPYVPTDEIREYSRANPNKYVIDIRTRDEFAKAHIDGAINIPEDELEIRAPREVPAGADVAVFCQYYSECEESFRRKGVLTNCTISTMMLSSLGIAARLLPAEMMDMEKAGLAIVRDQPQPQ